MIAVIAADRRGCAAAITWKTRSALTERSSSPSPCSVSVSVMIARFTCAKPSSAASAASGNWVMLTVLAPISRCQAPSALVENRGPWITTLVPASCGVSPMPRRADAAIARNCALYGAAKGRCCTPGSRSPSSKKVSARPHVRSMSWSVSRRSPGFAAGSRPPTAFVESRMSAPSEASAHSCARTFNACGGTRCPAPWRGRNTTRRPAIVVPVMPSTVPYGVFTGGRARASSASSEARPEPPMTAISASGREVDGAVSWRAEVIPSACARGRRGSMANSYAPVTGARAHPAVTIL